MFSNLFQRLFARSRPASRRNNNCPRVEVLEDRSVPTMIPDPVGGVLTFGGSLGIDQIDLRDVGGQVRVTLNGAVRSFADTSLTSIVVRNGDPSDSVTIESTLPATLTVDVEGDAALLGTLNLTDNASATNLIPGNYTVGFDSVTRHLTAPVIYHNVANLVVNAHLNDNTINVESTNADTNTTINAGEGSDTINVCPTSRHLDNLAGPLTINGDHSNVDPDSDGYVPYFDVVNIYDQNNGYDDTYLIGTSSAGMRLQRPFMGDIWIRKVERVALEAGIGANLIQLDTDIALTGVRSLNVDAGGGNDIVVGGAGSEQLLGGPGRDLLIGGPGRDVLDGGAGDDILIDGTTRYDDDPDALRALLSQWARSDRTYAQRVADLRVRVGASHYKLDGTTVTSDYDVDSLTGGADNDWFWAVNSAFLSLSGGPTKPHDSITDWYFMPAFSERIN